MQERYPCSPVMLISKWCPQVCYGRQAQHVDILFAHVRRHRHSRGAHAHLRRLQLLKQQAVQSPQLLWCREAQQSTSRSYLWEPSCTRGSPLCPAADRLQLGPLAA